MPIEVQIALCDLALGHRDPVIGGLFTGDIVSDKSWDA